MAERHCSAGKVNEMILKELVQALQAAQECWLRGDAVGMSKRQISLRDGLPVYMSGLYDGCFMAAMKWPYLNEGSEPVLQLAWILRID